MIFFWIFTPFVPNSASFKFSARGEKQIFRKISETVQFLKGWRIFLFKCIFQFWHSQIILQFFANIFISSLHFLLLCNIFPMNWICYRDQWRGSVSCLRLRSRRWGGRPCLPLTSGGSGGRWAGHGGGLHGFMQGGAGGSGERGGLRGGPKMCVFFVGGVKNIVCKTFQAFVNGMLSTDPKKAEICLKPTPPPLTVARPQVCVGFTVCMWHCTRRRRVRTRTTRSSSATFGTPTARRASMPPRS